MPSNLNLFGSVNSEQYNSTPTLGSTPSWLKKYKEQSSKEIAEWLLNNKTSTIDALIVAMGDGSAKVAYGESTSLDVYSAILLGKNSHNNRWQFNFSTNENMIIAYFDGNTFFKRLSINYESGALSGRCMSLRNGNTPSCGAYYQLAFGYSNEAAYEDYSLYRHNIRTSHSNDSDFNYENALDLYLWDKTNDTPSELGSRHVVRWNALGNEELIEGFRIDGGVDVDISTSTAITNETTNYAVSNKGVIYYNSNVGKYRYSENGGKFKYFGSGSGDSLESISLSQCVPFNNITANHALGVYKYSYEEISISKIAIMGAIDSSSTTGTIKIAIYKPSSVTSSFTSTTVFAPAATATITTTGKMEILEGTLSATVSLQGWYAILITYGTSNTGVPFMAGINQASLLADTTLFRTSIAMQFDDSTMYDVSGWSASLAPAYSNNGSIIPYFRLISD